MYLIIIVDCRVIRSTLLATTLASSSTCTGIFSDDNNNIYYVSYSTPVPKMFQEGARERRGGSKHVL
jgi:hypothetical protein